MNTIAFEFGKIILTVQDPKEWDFVKLLSGKVEDVAPGVFHFSMSTHNLKRIADHFTGDRKPRVVSGHRFLESLRSRLNDYKQARNQVQDVLSKPQYPVVPNGQFIPYAHQTQIIGVIDANPLSNILSDCGTGKTGAVARAIEIILGRGEIARGKVLISAPLSILNTSWEDDIKRFTGLKAALLWTPLANKVSLADEKCDLGTHQDKPAYAIATKTRTGTRYRNPVTGEMKEEIDSLDGAGWTKYRATWKVGIDLEGKEHPFGKITGRLATTEATRENYIKAQLARTDVDVFLINHDGVRIWEKLLKEYNFSWVVIDESTKVKNPTSKVFRAHVNISWKCKRRNILTGTPNPNGFIDLWAQHYFLDRGMTLEPCLKDFLYEYFTPEIVGYRKTPVGRKAAIKYVIKGDREKEALIARVRSTGILLEQRDCIDLPPRTDTRRLVYLTSAQEAAYRRMQQDLVTELTDAEGKTVRSDAVNVLAKIMKLRQITSGFLLNKEGDSVHVAHNPKWEDLDDYIDELGGKKLVIACQFREEIEHLLERYKDLGAAALYGDIALSERTDAIRRFQMDGGDGARIIILQPAAAAHGITLTAASHLVFASLDYNYEFYYQVAKRIERLGQKSPIFITHLLARFQDGESTIDEDLLEVLQMKSEDRTALFGSTQSLNDVSRMLTQKLIAKAKAKK